MPVGTLTRSHCLGIRDTIPTPLPSFYFIVFFLGGGGWVGRNVANCCEEDFRWRLF